MTVAASQVSGMVYYYLHGANYKDVLPYQFIQQWWYYKDYDLYKDSIEKSIIAGTIVGYVLPAILIVAILHKKKSLFGNAKFASWRDVVKMGMSKPGGIIIGKLKGKYIYYLGDAFVALFAPTRSGKGVSFVIPNLLLWRHSIVNTDFKLENFSITSKFRLLCGQEVYLFSPFTEDMKTHRYNPLGYVRDGAFSVSDILSIAEIIYPTDIGDATARHFAGLSQNLFLGLSLYIKHTEGLPFTIGEVLRQSDGRGRTLDEHLTDIVETREDLPESCISALNKFLSEDKTRGQANVLSSFNAPLNNWKNPIFDAATSANDFDLRDLRKKKMTIYVGITPDYIPVSGQILNLFFSHLINLNTKEEPKRNRALKYKCLLLMDEFPAMGRSGIIARSNSYFASYGLQLATIVQNKAQILAPVPEGYGKDIGATLIKNHEIQTVFTPEGDDAEDLSKHLGDTTVKSKSIQRTTGKGGRTTSTNQARRRLMLPQELQEMPDEDQIIKVRGKRSIYCNKIQYYNDPNFMNRLKSVSPSLRKYKGKMPNKEQFEDIIAKEELMINDIPEIKISQNFQHYEIPRVLEGKS
jgi:type IV secretion system protein VirD4